MSISLMAFVFIGSSMVTSSQDERARLAQFFPSSPDITAKIIQDLSPYTPGLEENPAQLAQALALQDKDYIEQLSIASLGSEVAPDNQISEIGEIYTVQDGDSYAKIAQNAGLRTDSLLVANNIDAKKIKSDAKALDLKKGQKIIIPFENLDSGDNLLAIAIEAASARKQALAQIQSQPKNKSKAKNGSKTLKLAASSGRDYGTYSGFTAGWCTAWVAKNRPDIGNAIRSVGGGNAGVWNRQARAAGLQVDRKPEVGAVLQTNETRNGHVSVIKEVTNGGMIVSEMNGTAGRGRVNERFIPSSMIVAVIH